MVSLAEVIQFYQHQIYNSQCDETTLLHSLNELNKLFLDETHLEETGVVQTVNALKLLGGQIGAAAKSLVAKWEKTIMAGEDRWETNAPLLDIIEHYKSIIHNAYRSEDKEFQLLYCLNQLNMLPIRAEHLEKTEISRTVRTLQIEGGEIEAASKYLVDKWEIIVLAAKTLEINYNGGENERLWASSKRRRRRSSSNENPSDGHKSLTCAHKQRHRNKEKEARVAKAQDSPLLVTESSKVQNLVTDHTVIPNLLTPDSKLEALDPSVALELQDMLSQPRAREEIQMETVVQKSISSARPIHTISDAEAIIYAVSSKNTKTKVYSGFRTRHTSPVLSPTQTSLQKNIEAIEDIQGKTFEVSEEPILERVTPEKLLAMENCNPYLMHDTDVLWQQHVSHKCRTKQRLENESWREMFIRCQKEEEQRLSLLKDSIKNSQKQPAVPVRKTKLSFDDSLTRTQQHIVKKQRRLNANTSQNVAAPAASKKEHRGSTRPKKAPLMAKSIRLFRCLSRR